MTKEQAEMELARAALCRANAEIAVIQIRMEMLRSRAHLCLSKLHYLRAMGGTEEAPLEEIDRRIAALLRLLQEDEFTAV